MNKYIYVIILVMMSFLAGIYFFTKPKIGSVQNQSIATVATITSTVSEDKIKEEILETIKSKKDFVNPTNKTITISDIKILSDPSKRFMLVSIFASYIYDSELHTLENKKSNLTEYQTKKIGNVLFFVGARNIEYYKDGSQNVEQLETSEISQPLTYYGSESPDGPSYDIMYSENRLRVSIYTTINPKIRHGGEIAVYKKAKDALYPVK